MKALSVSACLLAIIAAGSSAPSHAQVDWLEHQINEAALAGQADICWNQAIPAGYVVVAEKVTTACNGTNHPGSPNTRTVKEPYAGGEIICSFPIPAGFVITQDKITTGACSSTGSAGGWNAMNIRLAGSSETVCSNSPIPAGYQRSATISSSVCRTGFARKIWL